jgi:hypothetical protein
VEKGGVMPPPYWGSKRNYNGIEILVIDPRFALRWWLMNYMRELNAFRDWTMINRPSTGVIALWYMLMSINNMIGWKEWFTAPNQTVQLLTGLSRQGGESTRNSLIQYGLIEYKKGKSNQAGSYRMISLLEEKRSEVPVDNFPECRI